MAETRDVVRFEFLPRRPRFTPQEALHLARTMAKDRATRCAHDRHVEGQCGHLIACNYGFGALGLLKAIDMWEMLPKKYRRPGLDRMTKAPAGALLFIARPRAEDDAVLRRIIEESKTHIDLARAMQPA